MNSTIAFLLLLAATSSCASGSTALVGPSDLVGHWRCGPVVMRGPGLTVTASEEIAREEAGNYVSYGTTLVEAQGRAPVTLKDRSSGTWKLEDGILNIQVLRAEILSTSDPDVTMESAQRAQDAQLKKKSIYQDRIFEYTRVRYRTIPVNAMYKQAEVEQSCERI